MSNIQKKYARVWIYVWDDDGAYEKVEEQPDGIINYEGGSRHPMWINIDGKWIKLFRRFEGKSFAVLNVISKAEYETDLAFGLFKKLRITHRPIRTWIKKNLDAINVLNFIIACISFAFLPPLLKMAEESGVFWSIVATVLLIHLLASLFWMLYKIIEWIAIWPH